MTALLAAAALISLAPANKTQNVVFLFTDGLRWQEVFRGADEVLMKDAKPTDAHFKAYWRATREERREALMPFTWKTIAKHGQLFGNRDKGSTCQVLNGLKFSYPGYSETMQGYVDPEIKSNDNVPNKNVSVFEWLNAKRAFKGKVAVFGNWYVVSAIINKERCGFYVQSGMEPIAFADTPETRLFNRLQAQTNHPFPPDPADAFTFQASMMYLRMKRPRVMGVLFGETDSYAHSGDYSKYLDAAHRFDDWVREYWDYLQSQPQYKNKTTLIICPDHGRGDGEKWTSHGASVENAEYTWLMLLGPDTPALGERTNVATITNGQVASTIAALLGEDYCSAQPKAAKPIR